MRPSLSSTPSPPPTRAAAPSCPRRRTTWGLAGACALAASGCNAVLGNGDHELLFLDTDAEAGGAPVTDAGAAGVWGGATGDAGGGPAPGAHDANVADTQGAGTLGDGDDGSDGAVEWPIAFVQASSKDSKDSAATVSATYGHAQQAGDLAVVAVGWSDKAHAVSAISDTAGNAYVLALPPVSSAGASLAIYYAPNIAASVSNTVTVTLDVATDFPCIAVLEYAGARDVDQTAVGSGAGLTASSGTVVTSVARELVFGAGQPDQSDTANFASAGTGFDERVITGTSGMLAEDAIVTQVGTYGATGGLTKSSPWVMQIVTFK